MKTIGVFDSGVGGLSVANAIKDAFPDAKIEYRQDSKNVPYGTKTPEQIHALITPIFDELSLICDVIVVACNTVTTNLINTLRKEYSVPMIALEPMIKPAAQLTTSKKIIVCATPSTLTSKRYNYLKQQYAKNIEIIEPDCSDWSELIEKSELSVEKIKEDILPGIKQGADIIVLGCTHYHWIEDEVKNIAGKRVEILQPELAIITRLKVLL